MSEITDMLKQLVTMGAKFDSLVDQVNRMEERQIQLLQRISTLEERTNTIAESARSAASAGISDLRAQMIERVTRLEMGRGDSNTQKLLPPEASDNRDEGAA